MAFWRNKIIIKHMFTNERNDNNIVNICNALIPQLERINRNEMKRNDCKLDNSFLEEFQEIIDEFKWIKKSIEDQINAKDYDYDNWTEAFNYTLDSLYNLGDTITFKRDFFNDEKFLWVG